MREQDAHRADWEELAPPEGSLLGDYRVDLPVFEGPLDLLLHLIRKHEIDIFDIPISMITGKYLAYLEWMRVLNLDIAGEFLVMASTLAQIKSRMLLPPGQAEEEDLDEEEGDPREELVRRLLNYQRYKEAAEDLKDRPIMDRNVFARGTAPPQPAEDESPFGEVSVFKLIEALDRVMRNARRRVSHEIAVERISIIDRIHELAEELLRRKEVAFSDLFRGDYTKMMVIVTFIALLEMARLRMVRLHQAEGSEVLYVCNLLQQVQEVDEVLTSIRLED